MSVRAAVYVLYVAAILGFAGCVGERNLLISPEPARQSNVQLPISVRVELQEFTGKMNNVTPMNFDLKGAVVTYLNKRKSFKEVVPGPSDTVLKIKARFALDSSGFAFKYIIKLQGKLLDSQGASLGQYDAEGEGHGGATRFTADADRAPTNEALNYALDRLCDELERDHQVILAKLGHLPEAAVARMPAPERPVPLSDVDRVPAANAAKKKNAYAIVIGIEQYREKLPKADFADRDAKLVGEYLTRVMGYPEENVIVRTNDRATRTDLEKYFEGWLPNNVEKDSPVFIYYSGHGAPNSKTGEAYLVPYDGDPTFVDRTGYPIKQLYAALSKLPTTDVTVVLDSCFSGAGGRSVIAKGMRPMALTVEDSMLGSDNTIVLAASSGDQVSGTYEEQGHGLLTYYFLKGLQGDGDANRDGVIEMTELYEYVKPNVQRIARKQHNNEQTPQLLGKAEALKKRGGRLVERAKP